MMFSSLFWLLVVCIVLFFFFFSSRRRHTRFDCDWSSDVCSSDLIPLLEGSFDAIVYADVLEHLADPLRVLSELDRYLAPDGFVIVSVPNIEIGRASCRERV